jgi:hypothetical protein
MSEHVTEQCMVGRHGACDGKVRETTPVVTASNTRASRMTVYRCTCGCHWAPSYVTRGGVQVGAP